MDRLLPLPSMMLLLPALFQAYGGEGNLSREGTLIEVEARSFMAAYADDIRAARRKAIVARYDRGGAYRVGEGQKIFETHAVISASYESEWNPPRTFEWRDLSYEVIGENAVIVVGCFDWGTRAGKTLSFSYTGVLTRQNGELVIRLEDESRTRS